jgi:hypothetical protein
MMEFNAEFQWKCQPKAESIIAAILEKAIQENSFIAALAQDLHKHTSTRLFDWLDHVAASHTPELEKELIEAGFISDMAASTYRVFHHPGAQLPRVIVYDEGHGDDTIGVAVIVDRIDDFLMARGISALIEGTPLSGYRRCFVSTENGATLWVVERRGTLAMEPEYHDEGYLERYFAVREKWKSRARSLVDGDEAMRSALMTTQEIVEMVGKDLAACIILECEREYWQMRNTAGQVQKNRQDRLGMGWANHDHHTFRSSRRHFSQLVRLFEILGFHCRERFYAGKEAGWGAQVMENPRCRLVLFLDVDLDSEEIAIDFAHHPMHELQKLGTIGLWCALHGDSILKSGMHHLEAQFLFEELTKDLSHLGVEMMDPFSSFPYLKQAFTHGEIWHVEPHKVDALARSGKITQEQADKFKSYGAVGSHLENLQRREGYKGFNQKNVSFIIKKTDPRHQ